jgi:O-antigen/teichoic acid export membrane protein
MFTLLRSVDRLVIATFLQKDQLGLFAVGTIVSGLVYLTIGHVVGTVFAPRIMEKLGETGDKHDIFNYLFEPTIIIAYLTPFLVGTLFIAIHIPIKYFIPAYLPAIGVIQILCLAAFFISIVMLSMVVIIALNKQVILAFIMIATILLNAILSYIFVALDMGIKGVAIGTFISYCCLSLTVLWYAMRSFDLKASMYARNFFIIYAPFMYLVCLVILSDFFSMLNISGLKGDVINTLINLTLFYLLFGIVFFFIRSHPAFCKLSLSISALKPKITK